MRAEPSALVRQLLDWYRANRRELPWRRTRDPYRVWVSEVMLQQTRVEAVLPYYERFLSHYPGAAALAAAPQQELLAQWAGLGYYRRARLLHEAAQRILGEHGGRFPRDYDAIRRLPGIGEYTAAAIASIAFDQPRVALDGNALRVLARLVDDHRDITKPATRRSLQTIARELVEAVPKGERGDFTQALMELGATLCIPRFPRCQACPWSRSCLGLAAGTAAELPTKPPRRAPRRLAITVAIVRRGDSLLLRQRPHDAALMPGFWELPTVEGSWRNLSSLEPLRTVRWKRVGAFTHGITNTSYACSVYETDAAGRPASGYSWVARTRLSSLPLATITSKALQFTSEAPASDESR